jgi:hypothetical protein
MMGRQNLYFSDVRNFNPLLQEWVGDLGRSNRLPLRVCQEDHPFLGL